MTLAVFFLLVGILAAEVAVMGSAVAAYLGTLSFLLAGALLAHRWAITRSTQTTA